MIDNQTVHQKYPLPHPDNLLQNDVTRISDAITSIDGDIWQQNELQKLQQLKMAEKFRRLRINTLLEQPLLMV
ncbi:hypothetical protein [Pseudoalteromonas denitrificans]|uniref:Uncharacterized protein n=1 Tax=Pseudoalteromonas denitrificans DSM 6059 TaxID=1123010 RepID=A0A1I1Q3N0_9GAMM|nr:hypothetical protein [Pseudoalteromonas denitrificans]SFD16597.1 hypothetical protein SAMN02745724_03720 [Pseudoalteromonas denitrificans DSM 6059]